jgi:hypothetical protein
MTRHQAFQQQIQALIRQGFLLVADLPQRINISREVEARQ